MTATSEYEVDSPAAPDQEAEINPEEAEYAELANGPLACPLTINGAMIPGNVDPFHTTYVGNIANLMIRLQLLGKSPKGVPRARYNVPKGPWVSEDGSIKILRGTVDGFCWYKPTRLRIAMGSLHVYHADVEWYDNVAPQQPENPCDDLETDTIETECQPDGAPQGPRTSGSIGQTSTYSGPSIAPAKWVCYVTDWYERHNGGPWHYVNTVLDYCWLEAVS